MEHDGSEHRGQQQVGCVAITVMLTSFSLAWIWSMSIPSGRGSKGLLSIRTSFLYQHRFTRSCESAVYHPCFSPSNPINSPLHQSRPRANKLVKSGEIKKDSILRWTPAAVLIVEGRQKP